MSKRLRGMIWYDEGIVPLVKVELLLSVLTHVSIKPIIFTTVLQYVGLVYEVFIGFQ